MGAMNIPGFVDVQVNGYAGIDFSSPTLREEDLPKICEILRQSGIAAFLPTIITSAKKDIQRNLGIISNAVERYKLQKIIPGIHLEGPFISSKDGARGAHPKKHILEPDIPVLDEFIDAAGGLLKILTVAAEVKNADLLSEYAVGQGLVVAMGHQLSDFTSIRNLIDKGATVATHLGNGLPTMIHRHHNPLFSALASEELTATIITDGHHLSENLLRIIYKTKGAENIVVISDCAPIAGLDCGRYSMFGSEVELLPEGKIVGVGTDYLAGSASNMFECMNYLSSLSWLSAEELIQVSIENPLNLIGWKLEDLDPLDNISYNHETNQFELSSN